jgi:hypothetical protein
MGRVTEWVEYLNNDSKTIEKQFTHLTITEKLALLKYEIRKKER